VREFVTTAAAKLDIAIRWEGTGASEKGYAADGRCLVSVDERYYRPAEVETLLGDASKAHAKLGWKPRIDFDTLVAEMVEQDLTVAKRDDLVREHGYTANDFHE